MTANGLNVLMLGPYPKDPDRLVGGVMAVNWTLANTLVRHHEINKVTVVDLVRARHNQPPVQINEKLEVRYLSVPFLSGDVVIRSQQCVMAVRRILAEVRPDVVHGQGIDRQGEVATRLGLPSVITVHGLVHLEARLAAKTWSDRAKVVLFDAMVRRVLRRANVTISISDYDARALEGLVGGERISISNAIAPEFFAQAPGLPTEPRLLFAGVMRPRKNVLGLVNAFAQLRHKLPTARLVIAGPAPDADYAAQVQGRVQALGLGDAVEFLGHVSNEQLIDAVRSCSALALFSYEETSPTIIAQALAVGRPVIASRVGGIPEMVVAGDTGYMVAPGDEQALAARLFDVLHNPDQTYRMGQRGRALALQRYEPSAIADQTVRAYRIAMARAASGQARTAPASSLAAQAGQPPSGQ